MKELELNLIDFADLSTKMCQWRRIIHQYPETGFEEYRTAKLVSTVLLEHGIEVHENIATTGVVGIIKKGNSKRVVGLRADLDALNLDEFNQFEHRSKIAGKMHACGHDGHTAMLLGAACYLSKHSDFDGTIVFIFQPAEEIGDGGGAQKMIEEGLFEKFPMDAVFGMHNYPTKAVGDFFITPGPMMSAYGSFECKIQGTGMHSSMPHLAIDPIGIGIEISQKWKSIIYNDIDPLQAAIISITQFHSGTADNISPEIAELKGSTRCLSTETSVIIEKRMRDIALQICDMNNAKCEFIYRQCFPALVNDTACTNIAADVASTLVGNDRVSRNIDPILGSEDFAFMLEKCPGAYILIGNGTGVNGGCMVHNPNYDFNDDVLDIGASYWVNLAKTFLQDRK